MTAHAARIVSSPVQVTLADLVRLRPAGESLKLTAPRIRVATEGGHVSPYKGRGVEFDESRPYQPGDDLRTMDWRVTARTGKPHTKVFREERNRPVFVWLDLRRPMLFATRGAYKGVRAAEVAALVAWSAVANGDRLGGLVFSETEHHERRLRMLLAHGPDRVRQVLEQRLGAGPGPAALGFAEAPLVVGEHGDPPRREPGAGQAEAPPIIAVAVQRDHDGARFGDLGAQRRHGDVVDVDDAFGDRTEPVRSRTRGRDAGHVRRPERPRCRDRAGRACCLP